MQREEAHSQSARDFNVGPSCSHRAILDQVLDYPKPWFLHLQIGIMECPPRDTGNTGEAMHANEPPTHHGDYLSGPKLEVVLPVQGSKSNPQTPNSGTLCLES